MPARLLLVDDEPNYLAALQEMLQGEYTLDLAGSAEEAAAAVRKNIPDLAVIDVRMPKTDGYQLLSILKEIDRHIPVIFVIDIADSMNEFQGLEYGAVDYLTKPFNPQLVKIRVRNQILMRNWNDSLLHIVIDTSPNILAFKDTNGVYRLANDSFCAMIGIAREKLYGMTDDDIFPPEEAARFRIEDAEVLAAGESRTYNECLDTVNTHQEVLLSVVKSPMYSSRMHLLGILIIGSDITARVKAEKEQKKLQEQIFQLQKSGVIGHLTVGIAHDFNNMMVGITSYTELGIRNLPPEHKVYKFLQNILNVTQKLTGLIRQLLDFSRKGSILPVRLDLNAEVEKSLNLFKVMINRNITSELRLGENVPDIFINPVQLDQVIVNFLSNAVDAIGTDRKGTITFTTAEFIHSGGGELQEMQPGRYACLTISDSGCGIAPDLLKKIFDPFFTTKSEGKGTGLGLPGIYRIITQNHGHLTVHSTPDVGTSFTVYFPEYKDGKDTKPENIPLPLV